MKRSYVRTPTGQVHCVIAGQGEPVLLIPQTPRSWRVYRRLMPLLATQYQVIAVDLPGLGDSDPLPEPFDVADLATSLAHVLDGLELDSVRVLGRHTGAAVGAELAASQPQRVVALVLHGLPYLIGDDEREEHIKLGHRALGGPGTLPVVRLETDGSHNVRLWQRAITLLWQAKGAIPDENLSDEDLEFVNDLFMDALRAHRSISATFQAVFTYNADVRLPLIKAPTLLLQSTAAWSRPIAQRAQAVKLLIPECTAVMIESGDRYDLYWRAQEISKLVMTFFRDPRSFQSGDPGS